MGFLARTLVTLALACGLAAPVCALEAIPGPPLPGGEARAGAFCPAPRGPKGPWHAAGFGAAVVAVGLVARRQGARA